MGRKKKATASNPNRGFATTSIASKAQVAAKEAPTPEALSSGTATPTTDKTPSTSGTKSSKAAQDATSVSKEQAAAPSESLDFETLELFRLQQLHAPHVNRVVQRYVQADGLRAQKSSFELSKGSILPETVLLTVLESYKEQLQANVRTEEVGVRECWGVWKLLVGMKVKEEVIKRGLEWWVRSGKKGGIEEGVEEIGDWIVCELGWEQALETEAEEEMEEASEDEATSRRGMNRERDEDKAPQADADVSDNDELPEDPSLMVEKYLSLQRRIFAVSPAHAPDPVQAKRKGIPPTGVGQIGIAKLLARIKRLQQDPLFEKDDAERAWFAERMDMARESGRAERQKAKKPKEPIVEPSEANKQAPADGNADIEEDGGLMGGLFGEEEAEPQATTEGKVIEMRDFEEASAKQDKFSKKKKLEGDGRVAFKVLEETLGSQKPKRKVKLNPIHSSGSSARASLSIYGRKTLETLDVLVLEKLHITASPIRGGLKFEMKDFAARTEDQALGYISTVTLWYVARESKAYTRLVGVWKNVWNEIVEVDKEVKDDEERRVIKVVQEIVNAAPETVSREKGKEGKEATSQKAEEEDEKQGPSPEEVKEIWQKKAGSPAFLKMLEFREQLPMSNFKDEVLQVIEENQITIICGETGCGKSTQVPAFILEHELSSGRDCRIYCTEPRRISAISLARRVSEELGERKQDVGTRNSLVGYAIRLESKMTANTRLVYATTGVVMRMLESSNDLKGITHLILDEVHERSIDSDFLLVVLRKLLVKRKDLKVVLMSATVDADKFSNYLGGAPVLQVPGRTFPVQTRFLEDAIEYSGFYLEDSVRNFGNRKKKGWQEWDMLEEDLDSEIAKMDISELDDYSDQTKKTLARMDEARISYELIIKLLETMDSNPEFVPYSNAILIFLPGIAEIRRLNDMLSSHPFFSSRTRWLVYPLHSSIASEDQEAAFLIPPRGIRKIVLATNIAETGITIPDITCVIDTGRHKEMRFDEKKGISRLVETFISRANAKQRRGRAGRVQEGICWHMFTKQRFERAMAPQQTPEMLRLSLQDLALRVKMCKLGGIEETLTSALDAPNTKNIRSATLALVDAGALTQSEELTELGKKLAKLPLDIFLGKLVLNGLKFSCIDSAVTIAALQSSKPPFVTPFNYRAEAEKARLGFKWGNSDLFTSLRAYWAWKRVCMEKKTSGAYDFCNRNYLSHKNLSQIEDLKLHLYTVLSDEGLLPLEREFRTQLNRLRSSTSYTTFFTPPEEKNKYSTALPLLTPLIATSSYPSLLYRDLSSLPFSLLTSSTPVSFHPTSVLSISPPSELKSSRWAAYSSLLKTQSGKVQATDATLLGERDVLLWCGNVDIEGVKGRISLEGGRVKWVMDRSEAVGVRVARRLIAKGDVEWLVGQVGGEGVLGKEPGVAGL